MWTRSLGIALLLIISARFSSTFMAYPSRGEGLKAACRAESAAVGEALITARP
jgi:hypothetical protein